MAAAPELTCSFLAGLSTKFNAHPCSQPSGVLPRAALSGQAPLRPSSDASPCLPLLGSVNAVSPERTRSRVCESARI